MKGDGKEPIRTMRKFVGIANDLLVGQDIFAAVGIAMQVTTQP